MLWGYCKDCVRRGGESCLLKECEYCDDYYCSVCAPCSEDIICCTRHVTGLDFCSGECMDAYIERFCTCIAFDGLSTDSSSSDNEC